MHPRPSFSIRLYRCPRLRYGRKEGVWNGFDEVTDNGLRAAQDYGRAVIDVRDEVRSINLSRRLVRILMDCLLTS